MYAVSLETSDESEQQARRTKLEREAVGVGNIYYNMQPTSVTAIDKGLIVKRMEVCLQYFLNDGGTELLWIQGEVILVSYGENITNNKVDKRATRLERL